MKGRGFTYILLSRLMVPLGLLILFAAYQWCFKLTIENYHRYAELQQGSAKGSLSISPAYSTTREKAVEHICRRFLVDPLVWKNDLWNQCARLSQRHNCSVEGFLEARTLESEDRSVLLQEVVFNGDFYDLLAMQHALDTTKSIGLTGGLSYSRNPRATQTTLKVYFMAMQKGKYK